MEEKVIEPVVKQENEKGATMVEYALLVALIAVALISAVVSLKTQVSTSFSRSNSALRQ
jgi:Flp pilus assembly pilin Flp